MGGRFHHALGVTGGADAPPFAGVGDQKIFAALIAIGAGAAIRQYAALQKLPQIPLYLSGNLIIIRIGLSLMGQPAHQVVLHRLVGGRALRLAALVYTGFGGRVLVKLGSKHAHEVQQGPDPY